VFGRISKYPNHASGTVGLSALNTNLVSMHPVLFEIGSVAIYSYGFMIAVGIIAGMAYLIVAGKKETGLTFDQANMLFL
jgi:prolipoprotein diacylglyceryltransferase